MAQMDNCKNRFDKSKCHPWIIKTFERLREIVSPTDKDTIDYTYTRDYPGKADKICSKCKYFET